MAYFNDSRCVADGVYSTDPLLFTCELNAVMLLQLVLPTGDQEYISIGGSADNMVLPAGFTVKFLNMRVIDEVTKNFSLSLSIANASLLEDGEIKCYDSLGNGALAGCLLRSKPQCLV